ncbi:MAG: molecular chaperone TorD family protein [Sulfuritalea sp.]|nr:molecular chaperone TorD family protein [Sulfuritalea sp.]
MMDARVNDQDTLRADFYLCLARAFLAPQDPALFAALRDDLADELGDLAGEIGYEMVGEIAEYRRRIHSVPDAGALLGIYSRLFLQPPRAVHINSGVYLDGSLNGGSVMEMEAWYRACGLERSADFFDLSDHVAVQLECIAHLFAHALQDRKGDPDTPSGMARQFIGRFVIRWIGAWCADLELTERELEMPDEPYLPLARILQAAAAADAQALPDLEPARLRREKALAQARNKQAGKGVTEDDLAEIRRRLEAHGLATDHLAVDPDQRDKARGWHRMVPPVPHGK